jgi:hypothetical protein
MTGAETCYQHAPLPHHTHTIGGRDRMAERQSISERFWAKVDRLGAGECWEWLGYRSENGYGRFMPVYTIAPLYAHRWSYEATHGPIPKGLQVDHLCRNRSCVNPSHLEVVTPRDNVLRSTNFAAVHARKTHCPQGHPYDQQNTILYRGRRHCRACRTRHNRNTVLRRSAERARTRLTAFGVWPEGNA